MRERIFVVKARRLPSARSGGDKIPPEEGGDGKSKYPGKYESLGSIELLSYVFSDLIKTSNIPEDDIADVITGCALQDGDQGVNVSRVALLTAGVKQTIPATTVNRLCGSSLSATMKGVEFLIAGQSFADEKPGVVVVGGIEHMGHHNMIESFLPSKYLYEKFVKKNVIALNMGLTAEKLADIYKISRKEQEEFAYKSHVKAVKAAREGRFVNEIIPVTLPSGEILVNDVGPRDYSSLDDALSQFAKLKPAFKEGGTVTAATSAPYTDGAAGLILVSETYAKARGLEPLAEIVSWASIGLDPTIMGLGPVRASEIAAKRAGIELSKIGLIEMNEAFCSQSIACIKQLCINNKLDERNLTGIINVNGGATALGHPLGATGAKLVTTIVHELARRKDVEYGLVTMCIGMGQGDAMIIRNKSFL